MFRVLAALAFVTLVGLGWLLAPSHGKPTISVEIDDRPGLYADPRHTLARIQSNFERVAAGREPWPSKSRDPLEAIVDAYAFFLKGDTTKMDLVLAEIGPVIGEGDEAQRYSQRLDDAAATGSPLTRLLANLRKVDATLFLKAADSERANPENRHTSSLSIMASPLNDTWLRLPCRSVIGRSSQFAETAAQLGDLAGPILACPSAEQDPSRLEKLTRARDFTAHERSPRNISAQTAPPEPSPPPQPWNRQTAVELMGDAPGTAEPILAAAADLDPVGKLDYALFLHAFKPASPERDDHIRALLGNVDVQSLQKADEYELNVIGQPVSYDGSDASLLASLQLASSSGVANTDSAFYALPCAVLVARPDLVDATVPAFGGNRDNFMPRSGCSWGRGSVRGFPNAELEAFVAASAEADGNFYLNYEGTLKFALATGQNATHETLKVNPRVFLHATEQGQDYPYQVWGMTSLANRAAALRIKGLYEAAHAKLLPYFQRLGLSPEEASRAAKTGLFASVFGADCGGEKAGPSLRGLLLDKAPVEAIRSLIESGGTGEAAEISACAAYSGLDPLLHIAIGHSAALPLILKRETDVNARNTFGKTPLMVAAQFDQLESARLLLLKRAKINAATWQDDPYPSLAHDARTALMYAAATASLPMIKELLAAGADPLQADTKGMRAIHYLLGFGPLPANGKLTAEERAEAVLLLF